VPAILATLVAACSSSPTTSGNGGGANATVNATAGLQFNPNSVTIAVGQSVAWAFASVGHNVTFDNVNGHPASILGSNASTTISRTFPTAGDFTYHCTIHPEMTGVVHVTAAGASSSGNQQPPQDPGTGNPYDPPPYGGARGGS
jgi:plastocyanin